MLRLSIVFLFAFSLYAQESSDFDHKTDQESWELFRFNLYFENDLFSTSDNQYSSGEKFNFIYHVENPQSTFYDLLFLDLGEEDVYMSFSLANMIFTPEDLSQTGLIVDDRPYTGWTYVEASLHKSSASRLHSLYLQIGYVGPNSKAEEIQTAIHEMTDSEPPMGWDNQLSNELGVNLRYIHKWRFAPEPLFNVETAFVPFVEGDLGNIIVQASAGMSMRVGWNIPKDFGISSLGTGGEVGIPVSSAHKKMMEQPWSFSFNLSGSGSAIARDISLDGNTFKASHSVEKKNFVGYLGYGFSLRYKSFMLEYIKNANSKRFEEENKPHAVGTVVASWLF